MNNNTKNQSILIKVKALIYRHLRKKIEYASPLGYNYFLKPNDAISHLPITGYLHDEEVVRSLDFLSSIFNDYFIDVGANIGLVSLQIGLKANHTWCVEPNPLIFNILKTNLALNLKEYKIFEYGLGEKECDLELYVPKNNMGGAFVLSGNQYSDVELAEKDGLLKFDELNYVKQNVKIKSSSIFWQQLLSHNPQSVLIKIDVEGYEDSIIDSILYNLKPLIAAQQLAFVFESHSLVLPNKIKDLMVPFGYTVCNPRIDISPKYRNAVLRRIIKMWRGESRTLTFFDLTAPVNSAYRNYLCAPSNVINCKN